MTTSAPNDKSPAVFLDRDGTLIHDVPYCGDPKRVAVLKGAAAALQKLKAAGFKIIVITNQSGLGRGYFTEADYRAVEQEVSQQIGSGMIDGSYFCPDVPGVASDRRKPAPGMVFEAESDHRIDLLRSFFVGDKWIDAECGHNAGLRSILVQTGCERHEANGGPTWIANDLAEAAEMILRNGV